MLTFLEGVMLSGFGAAVSMIIMRWYVRRGEDGTCPICGADYGPWTEPFKDDQEVLKP